MATESVGATRPSRVDWLRAEFVLTALGILAFITFAAQRISGGMPTGLGILISGL